MRYSLAYGNGHLSVDFDTLGNTQEVVPKSVVAHPDIDGEVVTAIEHPVEANPPSKSLSDSSTVALVVDAPSPVCPSRSLLESVLSYLKGFGIGPANVTILAAHRVGFIHAEYEINRQLGDPMSSGHTLVIHDPNDSNSLSAIGETPSYHTPLEVNRAFLEADYRIGLGAILPDPLAGATGGGMSVLPGVSGQKTILRNMKLRVSTGNGLLDVTSPASVDTIEASYLSGLDFIINTVPDWKGSVADVVAGDALAAWHKGIETSRALSSATVSWMADVVLVSAGGYPFDQTLYDAVDCLSAAQQCCRNDGVIVLVAGCSEGLGPVGFRKGLFESKSEKDAISAAKRRFEIGLEKSRLFRHVTDRRKLVICSSLQEPLLEDRLMCTITSDLTEALEVARHHLGNWSNTILLPRGRFTVIQGP